MIRFKLLYEFQFGFRKFFTTLAISKIYHEILGNIDQGTYTCCIFLDFKKAVVTVGHYILFQKLEISNGFKGIALDIKKSYLTNRKQCNKILNNHSTKQNIISGFPQGSLLVIYICYLFYMLTFNLQLHFFRRHVLQTTLFCPWLTKTKILLKKRVNSCLKLLVIGCEITNYLLTSLLPNFLLIN